MPNIARMLRDEISRIARREAKSAVAPVKKPVVQNRRTTADLKARLTVLERENREIKALLDALVAGMPATPAPDTDKARITAKGMKALRRKLKLTQKDFGRLIGVTSQAVTMWEKKTGALRLKSATRAAVLSIRGIGAKEARKRLEAAVEKPVKVKTVRRKRVVRRK